MSRFTAKFVNIQFNKEDLFWYKKKIISLKDTLHRSCWKNFLVVWINKSEVFEGCYKHLDTGILLTGVQGAAKGKPQTARTDNVDLLVTSCWVRKVRHWHISQEVNVQGILEFDGHQLVASSTRILGWNVTHRFQKKTTYIRLLMHSWIVQ